MPLLREEMKQRDLNNDGELSDREIKWIKTLQLRAEKSGKYWKLNLKGLSWLTSLEDLSVEALVLENRAELEQLKSLQKLYLYQYQDIGVFDLSRMENVTDFSLGSKSVQEVILRNNKKLKKLYFGFTSTQNLKEVNLCENPNLEEVELRVDSIEKIRTQGHGKLKKMEINTDEQIMMKIEKIPKLSDLVLKYNPKLTKLWIQDCPSLETLWVES